MVRARSGSYRASAEGDARILAFTQRLTPQFREGCLKAFGDRIAARHPDRQTAEIQISVALINRFNALDTAEIIRVD